MPAATPRSSLPRLDSERQARGLAHPSALLDSPVRKRRQCKARVHEAGL